MDVLGFTSEDQDSIFRILASILHLGNVYFEKHEVRDTQSLLKSQQNQACAFPLCPSFPPPCDRVSLCSHDCPGTHSVDQAGLDSEIRPVYYTHMTLPPIRLV